MKSVAIYCVNYQSYDSLIHFLSSVDKALEQAVETVSVSVFVADNTVPPSAVDYKPHLFHITIIPTKRNLGYFGAVNEAMKQNPPQTYDYIIVSNVDVELSIDFFVKLNKFKASTTIGWIAPQIYSITEKRDRNPKILQRYAKRKLQILKTLFSIPPLYNLYTHTIYKSKKLATHSPGEIYAGHGSFIILSRSFFQKCGIIDYPVFLFCEEIYLGEQCREHGLKVVYDPTLKVTDIEHASTGTIRRRQYCKYNYDAISFILNRYY